MEKAAWQALPPRRRGRRCDQDAGADGSVAAKKMKIEENVQARADKSAAGAWADATLESKDGCAGEFYEYLDHTADVQCHTWGPTLEMAFEAMAPCMFNYMTDLTDITEDSACVVEFTITGHDLKSLLFNYMDEMLFRFCTDGLCIRRLEVLEQIDPAGTATGRWTGEDEAEEGPSTEKGPELKCVCRAHGCTFDRSKHVQGTEIKAITYSNMQVHIKEDKCDLYVIVDI
jgi:SHS2 domain-containing protein